MKTGDHLQDGNGRTFQVGQLLGRGLWGKCYLARESTDGQEWVIKVPLGDEDLPHDPPRLAEACREIAREQGRLLEDSGNEALVQLETRFVADDGSPTLLMPRYPETLERRMADLASMDEVLHALGSALGALEKLATMMPVHGGIKPSNILMGPNGEVRLMDPVTPTLRRWLPVLAARDGYLGDAYMPPETRKSSTEPTLGPTSDTFALAMTLYRAATMTGDVQNVVQAALDGLQKGDVQALKDKLHNRLKNEPSNPRFHARLADRAAAIVNRAISIETSPSPPYRFNKLDEFKARLDEVQALVHPTITHVGKMILNRPPAQDGFSTDEDVRFSCTVGASQGVETHEEIAAGIAIFDHEKNERLRNLACSYTVDRHPSGRFRFSFRVADMAPGQYLARVAYTIRDSGHEPATAEERFQVIAAPGYVPPRTEPERQPISMERPPEGETTQEKTVTAEIHPPGLDSSASVSDGQGGDSTEPEVTPLQPIPLHKPGSSDAYEAEVYQAEATERLPMPLEDVAPVPLPIDRDVPIQTPGPDSRQDPGVDEPEYRGAGRWSELPLPNAGGQELPAPKAPTPVSRATPDPLDKGPVAEMFGRALSVIRSDAYLLFLGAAGLVIFLLLAALWFLPAS